MNVNENPSVNESYKLEYYIIFNFSLHIKSSTFLLVIWPTWCFSLVFIHFHLKHVMKNKYGVRYVLSPAVKKRLHIYFKFIGLL